MILPKKISTPSCSRRFSCSLWGTEDIAHQPTRGDLPGAGGAVTLTEAPQSTAPTPGPLAIPPSGRGVGQPPTHLFLRQHGRPGVLPRRREDFLAACFKGHLVMKSFTQKSREDDVGTEATAQAVSGPVCSNPTRLPVLRLGHSGRPPPPGPPPGHQGPWTAQQPGVPQSPAAPIGTLPAPLP